MMTEIETLERLRQALVNYRRHLADQLANSPPIAQKNIIGNVAALRDVQADIELIDRAVADEHNLSASRQG